MKVGEHGEVSIVMLPNGQFAPADECQRADIPESVYNAMVKQDEAAANQDDDEPVQYKTVKAYVLKNGIYID